MSVRETARQLGLAYNTAEGARAELVDPSIYPRTRNTGEAKDLIDPLAANVVACGDGRDTLATMIRKDDLSGIIGR